MKRLFSILEKKPVQKYLLAGLVSLELLMSFSFLGYIHVEPISITFAFIPVLLAGALIGPRSAALLGLVFGLASMWKASAPYVADADRIFSPFLSDSPASSLLLSVGSRTLFGFVTGILYLLARRAKKYRLFWIGVVSFLGRSLHSFLVYGFMGLLFPEMGFNLLSTFNELASLSSLLTSAATTAIVLAACVFQGSRQFKDLEHRTNAVHHLRLGNRRTFFSAFITIFLTLIPAGAIALYFVQRMNYVLDTGGYHLDDAARYNLLHLQVQFLLGLLSLCVLVVILLLFSYQHTTYMRYEAKSDALTGVLNRNGFFPLCDHLLAGLSPQPDAYAYFLILDVDYFKHINDSLGHPKGDEILYNVAQCLQETFSSAGTIGRLGGDEFAVLLHRECTRKELEKALARFIRRVHQIPCASHRVSCSIGAVPILPAQNVQELYEQADLCLYLAKERGKDQYFIAAPPVQNGGPSAAAAR